MQEDDAQQSKRPKTDHAKTIWLITYGAGCQDISPEILNDCGLPVQECYTVQWRESKYTLVHLCARTRRYAIETKMKEMNQKYKIIQSQILGYESVAGNFQKTELEQHPGFQRMIELLNKQCQSLQCWMREKDVFTNKKGLLWSFLEASPDQASLSQMKRMVSKWQPMIREYEAMKPEHESILSRLGNCETKLEIADQQIAIMASDLEKERTFSEKTSKELSDKRKECMELQKELIRMKALIS